MGIKGYVTHADHSVMNSVAAEGKRSRYIKRPERKNASPRSMQMKECENHDPPHPTVPVELRLFWGEGKADEILGVGRACLFCWKVLKMPEAP